MADSIAFLYRKDRALRRPWKVMLLALGLGLLVAGAVIDRGPGNFGQHPDPVVVWVAAP